MPATYLLITHTKMGRTLSFHLHSTTVAYQTEPKLNNISEIYDIDQLVNIRLKVEKDSNSNCDTISLTTKLHELAKDDAIKINVSCDELDYADKWMCSGKWTEWIVIGKAGCFLINQGSGHYTKTSVTTVTISVYKIATYKSSKLYEDSDFTDFTLSTQDGNVEVHRACLAAHSPVFRAMFTGTWKETEENLIKIKGHTLQTVQHLKEFLYLGTLPDDGLHPLMSLAALYSIDDLKKECAMKLVQTVKVEDLYSLNKLAYEKNIPELSYAVAEMALKEIAHHASQKK